MPTMTMMSRQERGRTTRLVMLVLVAGVLVVATPVARARQADTASAPKAQAPATADTHTPPATDHPATPAPDHGAASGGHDAAASHAAAPGEHGESHEESVWVTLARVANFAILAGVIYWFARKPLAAHLAERGAQIRKDLVDAAETRRTAAARLHEIETKLAALPQELEHLRRRGTEELEAERTRVRTAAEAERDRLVAQARREIAAQTRAVRARLRERAAALAVEVAEDRLRGTLTPSEQTALVDAYATQMRNVQ